MRARER